MWQIQFLFPPKYGDFGPSFPKKKPLNRSQPILFLVTNQVAKIHHKNNPGHYM
jgi:hypothetical protein